MQTTLRSECAPLSDMPPLCVCANALTQATAATGWQDPARAHAVAPIHDPISLQQV